MCPTQCHNRLDHDVLCDGTLEQFFWFVHSSAAGLVAGVVFWLLVLLVLVLLLLAAVERSVSKFC